MKIMQKAKFLFTLILAALVSTPLVAQQDKEGVGFELEEVIVTARKVKEDMQRTPIAVSAFTGEELIDIRGVVDMTGIGDFAPNVNLGAAAPLGGTSAAMTIFIRGMGQADFNIVADPAVGVYVDGVFIPRGVGSLLDLLDLERVEILRGPQGTLFGRNTIGGAINLISKKPHETYEASAAFTVGEDNLLIARGLLNIPVSDNFFLRLSASGTKQDGFVDALEYDDKNYQFGEKNSAVARVVARWLASDSVTVDFSADYNTSSEAPGPYYLVSGTGITGEPGFPPGPDAGAFNARTGGDCLTLVGTQTNFDCFGSVWEFDNHYQSGALFFDDELNTIKPDNDMDIFGLSLTVEWDTNIGMLKSITAYRDVDSHFYGDATHTPHLLFQNINKYTNESLSQEFQLTGSILDNRLDYVAGLYYFEEEGTQNVFLQRAALYQFAEPTNLGQIFSDDYRIVDNSSKAAYAQATYHFSERAHLTLGLRYTEGVKDVEFQLNRDPYILPLPGLPSSQNFFGHLKETVTDPLVTFGWDFNEDIFGYVTYSEGFRDGGFPGRFIGAVTEASSYDPEFATAYEAGLKMTFPDQGLRLNLAIFKNDVDDFQVAASSVDPRINTTLVDNLADVSFSGVEAEIMWVATDNLRFDVSLGYLKNEINSLVGGELISLGQRITTDNELPFAPEWSWNVGASHILPFSNSGSLMTRLDWFHSDGQYYRIENTPAVWQPSYDTLKLSFTYRMPGDAWEFQLGAKNLTDEEYSTSIAPIGATGSVIGNLSRPRTIFFTARYSFGG